MRTTMPDACPNTVWNGSTRSSPRSLTQRTPGTWTSPVPGYRLHPLRGDMVGYWSVAVSRNYRIVFRIDEGEATDVDLVDYH